MKAIFTCLFALLYACVPLNPAYTTGDSGDKTLIYDNQAYEPDVKTILLNPTRNGLVELTQPAVLPIRQRDHLILSFDYLYGREEDFRARIIHCNADWTRSDFDNIEFLSSYNEFRIERFEQSFNTRVPYMHYVFEVPRVKLPGNYLLVVYRGNNPDDLILSSRFMIVDNRVLVEPRVGLSTGIMQRATNQQIDFSIDYSSLDINDPASEIKVVIRQNQRWDNAIRGLKPTFIRNFEKKLRYEFFNLENNFPGGNEFRFFDLRSVNFPGQNVNNIDLTENSITADLMEDRSRDNEAYATNRDLNGAFIIEKVDAGNADVEADYVNVNFFLKSPHIDTATVYVLGAMNNWEKTPANRMIYSQEAGGYLGRQLVKQGWYNYIYYVDGAGNNPYLFEGSHSQAENLYEILVYFRGIGSRGDLLVSYLLTNPNSLR